MLQPRRLAGLGLGFALALAAPAALASEAFTVREVAVDRTAGTAAEARSLALVAAQRAAFDRLVARLALSEAIAGLPSPSDAEITELVHDYEVGAEKTSPVRYIATITYRFHPEPVREMLRQHDVSFAETVSKPALVLPVLEREGRLQLWEEGNPWRQSWAIHGARDGLVPFVIPLGDLADIRDIAPEQAKAGDPERLIPLLQRYGAGYALVAVARERPGGAGGPAALEVTVGRVGPAVTPATVAAGTHVVSGDDVTESYDRVVVSVAAEIEESWKRDNALRFDEVGSLSVVARPGGLAEWMEMVRRLERAPVVRKSEVVSLSRTEAHLVLHYIGDESKLALALAQDDLVLAREGDGWTLRLRDGTQPAAVEGAE